MTVAPDISADTRKAPKADWVCVGVIAGAHGVSGEVKLKPFTDTPESLRQLQGQLHSMGGCKLKISQSHVKNDMLIARLEGVTTREEAAALKGEQLYVSRDSLPPPADDEFYHADLIGLAVIDSKGDVVGSVAAVQNFGAGDLLELALDHPRRFIGSSPLVPFERNTVPEINLARRRITVRIDEWIDSWVSADEAKNEGDE